MCKLLLIASFLLSNTIATARTSRSGATENVVAICGILKFSDGSIPSMAPLLSIVDRIPVRGESESYIKIQFQAPHGKKPRIDYEVLVLKHASENPQGPRRSVQESKNYALVYQQDSDGDETTVITSKVDPRLSVRCD